MKLQQKIILLSIIPLLLAAILIGFMIFELRSVKSSSQDIVDVLVEVGDLNGSIKLLEKSLSSFSISLTASDARDVRRSLEETEEIASTLGNQLTIPSQKELFERIEFKFTALTEKVDVALTNNDAAEVKRESLRTKGIVNDVYELYYIVDLQYQKLQEDLEKKIQGVISFATIAVITLILASSIFSVLFARRIVNPITLITRNAEKIAEGDLRVENLTVKTKDEVSVLNKAFSMMVVNLRTLIHEVGESSTQVAASAEQLMASADETMKGAEQISSSIHQVSSGAEQQTKLGEDSAEAVQEMTVGISRIANSASSLANLADSTNQEAQEGSTLVENTLEQMNSIQGTVSETVHFVGQLNHRSKEINEIVGLITDIAEQTNLLALNAAIEAARAGEAGKGFAVVADEVRKLADQTRASAMDITKIVDHVQTDSEKTVNSINQVQKQVGVGLQFTMDTTNKFREILRAMEQVNEQIQDISAVSEEINAGSEQVEASVSEMARVAKDASESTFEVVSASEEQLASMEEVNAASNSLANLAEQLQKTIERFKV